MLVARTSVSAAFVQPGHTHECQPFPNSCKGQPPPPGLDRSKSDHKKYVWLGWLALTARRS